MTSETPHIELYKKYRPNKWSQFIGQEKVARSLQVAVKADKIPTAFLFAGPRGTGKTSAAFLLAKSLNCEEPVDGNPCNVCETCVSIDNNTQAGVTYFSAAQKSGVDDIRSVVTQARLQMPVKKQVFIIDEIHNLRQGKGFEALLIPLEETTMPSLFIFCTTEIEKVPPTILSRVQQRKFNLVDSLKMKEHVEHVLEQEDISISEEDVLSAVKMGRGSVRDTLTSLESVISTGVTSFTYGGRLLDAMSTRSVANTFEVIAESSSESIDPRELSEQLFEDLRDLLLLANGCDKSFVGIPPVLDENAAVKGMLGSRGVMLFMKHLGDSITQMSMGADSRILLEIALMRGFSDLNKLAKRVSAKGNK